MDNKHIIEFFNNKAPVWDSINRQSPEIINKILDIAGINRGDRVLDVGCGTGVLINYYLERDVELVVGVDISSEMIRLASSKYQDPRVRFINDDVTDIGLGFEFDKVVAYNVFPHFMFPEKVLQNLSICLKQGGSLTVAHGASKDSINQCHNKLTDVYANDLIPAVELAAKFPDSININTVIDGDYYVVSGSKKIFSFTGDQYGRNQNY